MKILITGASGFIGKNLSVRLQNIPKYEITNISHLDAPSQIQKLVENSDFIIHLAGVNRPLNENEFKLGNSDFTENIINYIKLARRNIPIIYTSSTQALLNNPYGKSKLEAEKKLLKLNEDTGNKVFIYRLPNVFGKWCKPNYNSAIATFCHNIINDLPITIHDHSTKLNLVYIDDLLENMICLLDNYNTQNDVYREAYPVYTTTVGEIAEIIQEFKKSRESFIIPEVGTGLVRALYSTFSSFLPPKLFSYPLVKHEDKRGVFVEMIKTKNSGQVSYFTDKSGCMRGGHYHHSKVEKFLIVSGSARFDFRNILTNEIFNITVDGSNPQIVETSPGWTHSITNIGNNELVAIIWANEIFNQEKPDTIPEKVV